jgi:alcohol dehydrogenase class IV
MIQFRYLLFAQEVVFQPGALSQLGKLVDKYDWQRLMLVSGHSMRVNGAVETVKIGLGSRLVEIFDQTLPQVQDVQLEEVLEIARKKKVVAIIGLGGGSPIGMAKAVAFALGEQQTTKATQLHTPMEQPLIPVIAIPTTYAGSEMTSTYGITHTRAQPALKVTVNDPRVAPKLVVYDPQLTLDLPAEMTASTGMNALAHCIEALYSVTRQPFSSAIAARAAGYISRALPRCFENGRDVEARIEMLTGAHLAGLALAGVSMGLHHGLCHVLGGTANVPHGIANSIILPHAMRFNADATAELLLPAVEAMGIPLNGHEPVAAVQEAAQAIFELSGRMNLPQQLRQVGVDEADLPRLAQLAFQNHTVQNNPKPITHVEQIEALLEEAW